MKCKHKTGSVMEYHGNVSLSECDYGCGAIIVTVTDDNGISYEFTADELVTMRQFVAKVDMEAQAIIDNENSHVSMYFDAAKQNEQLRAQLAQLAEIESHAEKQLRHCPYCIQHNAEFLQRYPDAKNGGGVFSSSLAFKEKGRWYHLQLCAPQENSRGGYNWKECSEHEHHEYIAMIKGNARTLQDVIEALEASE